MNAQFMNWFDHGVAQTETVAQPAPPTYDPGPAKPTATDHSGESAGEFGP